MSSMKILGRSRSRAQVQVTDNAKAASSLGADTPEAHSSVEVDSLTITLIGASTELKFRILDLIFGWSDSRSHSHLLRCNFQGKGHGRRPFRVHPLDGSGGLHRHG